MQWMVGSLRDLQAVFWLRAASRPAPKQSPRPPQRQYPAREEHPLGR